jgi:uncharacterized protein (TIGR02117 family)
MRAIIWPTDSVGRAVAGPERPDVFYTDNEWDVLCFDQEHYALLIAFIVNSFLKDNDGNIIESKDDSDGKSLFYHATGRYHLLNTCNNWTAKGLKSAGLKISPTFKITPGSIMGYLSKHNKQSTGRYCEAVNSIEYE